MLYYLRIETLAGKMFSEEKRLQKLDNAFLRITIFVTYFRKSVTYVLTFMDRQSFALVRKILADSDFILFQSLQW